MAAKHDDTGEYIALRMGFFRGARVRTGLKFTVTEADLDDDGKFSADWALPVDADGNTTAPKGGKNAKAPAKAGDSLLDKSPQEIKAALSTMTQTEKAELGALDEAESKGKNRKAVRAAIADALTRGEIASPPGAAPGELTPSHPTIAAGGAASPADNASDPLA